VIFPNSVQRSNPFKEVTGTHNAQFFEEPARRNSRAGKAKQAIRRV